MSLPREGVTGVENDMQSKLQYERLCMDVQYNTPVRVGVPYCKYITYEKYYSRARKKQEEKTKNIGENREIE